MLSTSCGQTGRIYRPSRCSCLVSEPLSGHTPYLILGPLCVSHFKRSPTVVAEIELRQIPVKMVALAVLIDALHAPLEHKSCGAVRCKKAGAPRLFGQTADTSDLA